MKVLVTGAKGFLGKNLCATLNNIAQGKDRSFDVSSDISVYEYDLDTPEDCLRAWCADCDFVFHLAGVNRPKDPAQFMEGNCTFTETLLNMLSECGNSCPILLSSSVQAERNNPYGESKLAAERLLRAHGERTGAKILIYRFPNLFGKWCRPNYNSVVATFCYNAAHGFPLRIDDANARFRFVYVDDAVAELIAALSGKAHCNGAFCEVPVEYSATVGQLAQSIEHFSTLRASLSVPNLSDPFTAKLYATYLSYLPEKAFSYPLTPHCDARGSFTEILRTAERGQFSVNISKPGITKGNHWHHTKNEKFLVVSGRGVIRFRRIDSDEVISYYVSGEKPEVVDIPTGYTHHIENLGDCDLVTFMWASECFDPQKPDTYYLEV